MRQLIALNLRAARELAGVSQYELHRRLGLSRTYLSSLENGRANVSVDTLERMASELGTTVQELLKVPRSGQRSSKS